MWYAYANAKRFEQVIAKLLPNPRPYRQAPRRSFMKKTFIALLLLASMVIFASCSKAADPDS